MRYVLASIAPETKDSEFTWKDYQTRVNSELVGILGNMVNRVLVLTDKYFENHAPVGVQNKALQAFLSSQKDKITDSLENFRFREGLSELMNIARHGNQLLSEKEPWKTYKTDKALTAATLYDCLQIIANLAILCEPFLPFTSGKLFEMLHIDPANLTWNDAGRTDMIATGHQLGKASLLYQKIEDEQVTAQVDKLHSQKSIVNSQQSTTVNAAKKEIKMSDANGGDASEQRGEIAFDDFAKIDLRVGTILTAEKVEKADKLLKLIVDIGYETRTIVSGIAEHFRPEDIIGLQVCVVANLAPRKLRGIESKGMILLAENEAGQLIFVTPKKTIDNGSIVK